MTIDIVNVDSNGIKLGLLKSFEKLNNIEVNPNVDSLSIESICDKNVILQDPHNKAGIVFRKVLIQDLFPKRISIRDFKNKPKLNTSELSQDQVVDLNAKYDLNLVGVKIDILKGMSNAPNETIRDFILFCRVYGFYELDIGDVSIYKQDGKLTISVNDTNKLFTGYIEVLV